MGVNTLNQRALIYPNPFSSFFRWHHSEAHLPRCLPSCPVGLTLVTYHSLTLHPTLTLSFLLVSCPFLEVPGPHVKVLAITSLSLLEDSTDTHTDSCHLRCPHWTRLWTAMSSQKANTDAGHVMSTLSHPQTSHTSDTL